MDWKGIRWIFAFTAVMVALVLSLAWAATTYMAPPPTSARSGAATNRYALPEAGLIVVKVVTVGVADQTIALDPDLAGYLQRIVYSADGTDASWKLTITDASGFAVFSDLAISAVTDPCSVIANYGTRGIPFAGGLSVTIADADDGGGTAATIWLYIEEAWRR
jgi:hypothetical protein